MKSFQKNKPVITQGWIRALLFLVTYVLVALGAGFILAMVKLSRNKGQSLSQAPISEPLLIYGGFALVAAISFGLVWLFRRALDRRSFLSLGFEWEGHQRHALSGLLLGVLILSLGSLILFFHRNLQWTDVRFSGLDLFSGLMVMALIAGYEELVFRGYILQNLMESMNRWAALLVSALLFSLAHLGNPAISIAGAVNIFLAGCLLGINYIYTRNLWFGILLHFSWNFFQGPVLGFDVSGLDLQSLLQQEQQGPELLTGGAFGFEGSLVATGLCLAALGLLIPVYSKNFAARPQGASPGSVTRP